METNTFVSETLSDTHELLDLRCSMCLQSVEKKSRKSLVSMKIYEIQVARLKLNFSSSEWYKFYRMDVSTN